VFSQLLLYLAAKPCGWICEPFRGVAEHSSVMSMVLVSSYIRKWGAWPAFRPKTRSGSRLGRPIFQKTVRQMILQAVRPTPRDWSS